MLSKTRIPGLIEIPLDSKGLKVYKEDITHKDAISVILRSERPVGMFIHLAAKGNVIDPDIDSQEILDINIDGTRYVLDTYSTNKAMKLARAVIYPLESFPRPHEFVAI